MKNIVIISSAILIVFSVLPVQAGTFIVEDPGGRNTVEFVSKAPIENIIGTTAKISGKVTFDPADLKKPVQGKISVDLNTLSTGIDMRDEHMKSADYLNTAEYPFAVFEFNSPIETVTSKMEAGKSYDVKLNGKFTLHGVTRNIVVTGKAGYFKEVPELVEYGYPGDMLNFDGGFKIKLEDYSIKRPQFLIMKLAEEISISINFTATTGR